MRLAVFLVNTICRPINALFALADRDVCKFPNVTDDETCEVCGSNDVQRRGDWDYCVVGHIYVGKRAGLS